MSKWSRAKKKVSLLRTTSDYSDVSSPKKTRIREMENSFDNFMVRLPSTDPEEKGPQIQYTDGISNEHIDRLRKESTNRIQAKKQREREFKEMVKARNSRYRNSISFDKDKVPDFEKQLPSIFNLKFKRADALGVRNLIIDENELIRASRPNMDKLVVLSKLKHEIREPRPFDTPTSINQDEGNNSVIIIFT